MSAHSAWTRDSIDSHKRRQNQSRSARPDDELEQRERRASVVDQNPEAETGLTFGGNGQRPNKLPGRFRFDLKAGRKHAQVGRALAATKQDLAGLDLPLTAQGRLLLLTLFYGHRFYADPLRGWAGLPPAQAIDVVWQATLE